MKTVELVIVMCVFFAVGIVVGVVASMEDWRKQGMVWVASGQYSCELVPKQDKTTKWVCKETNNANQ